MLCLGFRAEELNRLHIYKHWRRRMRDNAVSVCLTKT